MVFSSATFIFIFLPLVLLVYIIIPSSFKNKFLFFASLFFYAWGERLWALLIIFSITVNYICGLLIVKNKSAAQKKSFLVVSIIINLGLIGVFKYTNFIIQNINILLAIIKIQPLPNDPVHLPIGISFFTFQSLSYVIDTYRDNTRVEKNFFDMGLYISMFPQLIAGPIVRYHDVASQIKKRLASVNDFYAGIYRFIIGLAKKMLIANTMAVIADRVFLLPEKSLGFSVAWLGIVSYTLQIYFDFSGYSDMAIGLGKMFGFTFLENFNYPYISKSIREFWRRWHISLSNWIRDYLYIPLGGNKISSGRTYVNLLIVFFLCGLWHGASWNFVIWGLFHGIFLSIERMKFGSWLDKRSSLLQHVYTLMVVMTAWVFFRAESISYSLVFLKAMSGFNMTTSLTAVDYLDSEKIIILICGILLSTPAVPELWKRIKDAKLVQNRISLYVLNFTEFSVFGLLFLLSLLYISAGTYNPFIYFRF